jgi:hypothetical protein
MFGVLALVLTIGTAGCNGTPAEPSESQDNEPLNGEDQPAMTEEPVEDEAEIEAEETEPIPEIDVPAGVTVENITINMLESQPVQFVAVVSGVITEPCLEVIDAYQVPSDFTLYLELVAVTSDQSTCPDPPVSFEISIYLNRDYLEPGEWTIVAGEITVTFEATEADLREPSPDESEPGDDVGADEFLMYDLAMIDSVTPLVRQGPPVEVELLVRGNLNDDCTELDGILQQGQDTSDIVVYLQTQRPQDAMCAQVIEPFETIIQLEGEFAPGDYTVTVNDEIEITFTVE